ncbi:MAG: hypothetical protein M1820_006511 [Bogoriella megaspora]|nr:MAG: hypothetical protein M1820_006511 [Bogoriella megaspora]
MAASGAKISLAFGAKKPNAAPRPQLGKRPRSALQDDQDEEDKAPEPQLITGFENGETTTVNGKLKEGPKIIPALKNRDFGEEARRKRQRSGLPVDPSTQAATSSNLDEDKPMEYGLITIEKKDEDSTITNGHSEPTSESTAEEAKPKTDDERALDALLGKKSSNVQAIAINEEEASHNNMEEAPDAPDLAAYTAMPVEDFGRALLLGMGWKEGQAIGRRNRGQLEAKRQEVKRRPEQLGVGAKADAALMADTGTDRKALKGRKDGTGTYNPVVLRNKVTGETFTEEELKKKQELEKMELESAKDEKKERRNKRDYDSGRDSDRRRDDRDRRRKDIERDGDSDRKRKDKEHRRKYEDDERDLEKTDDRKRQSRDHRRKYDEEEDGYYKHRSSKRDRSSSRDDRQRRHRRERSESREDKHRHRHRSKKDRDRRERDDHYGRDSRKHRNRD